LLASLARRYSNIVGGIQTSRLGAHDVPTGFLNEYNKVKATSAWATYEWAAASSHCSGGVFVTGHSLGAAMAQVMAIEKDLDNVYTFAAPKGVLNASGNCKGKRYYIDTSWGGDPVPGLPPWGTHTSSGAKLQGSLNWFSREYKLVEEGCGSNGGGGLNPAMHSSSLYEWYVAELVN
jgi:hypothetical protein